MTKYCNSASGKAYRLYLNTGTVPVPVWVEIVEAQDIDFNYTPDKVETPQRSSKYKLYDHGQIEAVISFTMTKRRGSTNVAHFIEATTDDCAWEYFLADGDITASGTYTGPRGGFKAFDASSSHPLNDQATMSIELATSYFEDVGSPGVEVALNPEASLVVP